MKLTNAGISNREEWIQKGYRLPEFDRKAVSKATKKSTVLGSFWKREHL